MKVGFKTTRTRQAKAPTILVLVQFLGAHRPLSAFDIRASLGVVLSNGTLYPMLQRLERNGWLRGEQVAGLRIPKRVYRLTRIGAREARALARQHARMAGGRWIIENGLRARDEQIERVIPDIVDGRPQLHSSHHRAG